MQSTRARCSCPVQNILYFAAAFIHRHCDLKQTFRIPHSLSNASSSLCFLNFEHLHSNPFCIFLHSGFRPADPSQGSHVGSSKPWDVPSDQPEPSHEDTSPCEDTQPIAAMDSNKQEGKAPSYFTDWWYERQQGRNLLSQDLSVGSCQPAP